MFASTRNKVLGLLAIGMLFAAYAFGVAAQELAVEGSAKADKLQQCVKSTDYMRRNHMEVIQHQRDITVHQGIRKTDDSLAGCIDCHVRYDTKQQAVPINGEGEFCSGCHSYAAVTVNCFQCHSTVPNSKSATIGLLDHNGFQLRRAFAARGRDGVLAHEVLREVTQEKGN